MALQINSTLSRAQAAMRWSQTQVYEPAHDERAQFAAQFIPAGARVLELNCGRGTLRRYLPNGCGYQGCDLVARDEETVVCDLNAGEFPTEAATQSDVIVMLGVLETIADVDSFFTHLRFCKRDLILSYCATDLTGNCDREALGWINHFSYFDLARLFDRFGFRIACTAPIDSAQALMRLTPSERLKPLMPCSVAVVSDAGADPFGGRLGRIMIDALLPGEAEVHHLSFDALGEARAHYDLLVLGTGDSLFQPLIGDDVLDLIARANASIGIFGTQYRELIPRPAIERVIDRLDHWFGRYEDDVLLYGRGRQNVEHLGDWLIDLFPLVQASEDEPLTVDAEPLEAAAIQRHRRVFSSRLHPLLCALTAAETAAYAEAPSAQAGGIVSGTFRSMLIDIFGRSYPERQFFLVERDAVARYKARVHHNVAAVRRRIAATLRNVALAAV